MNITIVTFVKIFGVAMALGIALAFSVFIYLNFRPSTAEDVYIAPIKRKITSTGSNRGNLDKLATFVQIEYFEKYLGEPVFVNFSKDRKTIEYVFENTLFFVQAITNSDSKVLSYAVTSGEKGLRAGLLSGMFNISLGKTKMSEVFKDDSGGKKADKCYYFKGNTASSYYFEEYYLGRPGKYQTYLFGYNDAGAPCSGSCLPDLNKGVSANTNVIKCDSIDAESRSNVVINTYMVISPDATASDLGVDFQNRYFGPNSMQINLLP